MSTKPAGAVTGAESKGSTQKIDKTPEVPNITAEAMHCCKSRASLEIAKENHTHNHSKYKGKGDLV